VAVALCRLGLGRLARHGSGAWRYNDDPLRMTLDDADGDAFLIIRAAAGERGERPRDLVEQETDLRAIVNIVGGSAPPGRSDQCRHRRRCAVCATTCAGSCHAFRPTTRRRCTASTQCCPPTDAQVRHWTAVAPPPASRPAGSAWNGQGWRDPDQAGE
jgi:hypothetical protein